MSTCGGDNGDQSLEGERVNGCDRLALAGKGVVVEAVAESFVEVGALGVTVVLRLSDTRRCDVCVQVDHDRGLLAEVEKAFERRLLGKKLVSGGGMSLDEGDGKSTRVCKTNVNRCEEDLELDLEEGLEVLEEVEYNAQRERQDGRVVRLRVLDDVLAEAALQQLDEGRVVHQHVAVHL